MVNTGEGEFGAIKTGVISNSTIVPVLAAILWAHDGDTDGPAFKTTLTRWYWSAVRTQDDSGSSDTVVAKEFRDWKEWMEAGDPIERITKVEPAFIDELDLKTVDKGSARYNAIGCLLALNDAKDFYKGRIVGTGDFTDEKSNDHHIFPNKVDGLDSEESRTFGSVKDTIVNRTLIRDRTNNHIKKNRPSQYLETLVDKHGNAENGRSIMEGHVVSAPAFAALKDDFDRVVRERERTSKDHLIDRIEPGKGGPHETTADS
jgi:hypothetical protein